MNSPVEYYICFRESRFFYKSIIEQKFCNATIVSSVLKRNGAETIYFCICKSQRHWDRESKLCKMQISVLMLRVGCDYEWRGKLSRELAFKTNASREDNIVHKASIRL